MKSEISKHCGVVRDYAERRSVGSVTANKDAQGNIVSYSSTVMTSTRNDKGQVVQKNTGIKITSGVKTDENGKLFK